jgi:phosphoglycerate dehydrogenase-like enzyme
MTDHEPIEVLSTLVVQELGERARRMAGIRLTMTEDRAETRRHLATARVLIARRVDAELLRGAPKLKLIHACTGGVEDVLIPELVASPIQLACLKGIFDVPGAERAMASMLAFTYRLPAYLRQQRERRHDWVAPHELRGKTVGIVGLGGIGMELARLAACFGARVIGCSRSEKASPHLAASLAPDRLEELLAASDFVVVCVPRTPLTEGLFGARQFRAMKRTAYLIDITGRSVIFELDALVRALREGWIAGADLQIQQGLPPSDSPLWELDNLILSNHSANSVEIRRQFVDRVVENLRRYREGLPLLGLVDKAAGY